MFRHCVRFIDQTDFKMTYRTEETQTKQYSVCLTV